MSKESVKPVEILTEEELKYIEALISLPNTKGIWRAKFKLVLASHRNLLSANAELAQTVVKQNSANLKLVYENDELMAENMLRQKYESFLKSVIRCGSTLADDYDFERFKQDLRPLKIELEEAK